MRGGWRGACSSPVRQQSGEHCEALGEHLLDDLGEHLHEAAAPLIEHLLGVLGSTGGRPRAHLASRRAGSSTYSWGSIGLRVDPMRKASTHCARVSTVPVCVGAHGATRWQVSMGPHSCAAGARMHMWCRGCSGH